MKFGFGIAMVMASMMAWSVQAGTAAMCPAYADAAMAVSNSMAAGLPKDAALATAVSSSQSVELRIVLIAIISAVYEDHMPPQAAHDAVLVACVENGGW